MSFCRKRFALLSTIIIMALFLSGCGLGAQSREVEQLLVIQTMGLDLTPDGVAVSLASASGVEAGSAPVRLNASGPSITVAIDKIRAGVSEDELFAAHIGHLLIGEDAARQGIAFALEYVRRSDNLRLSVPLYILRSGTAADAVLGVGNESYGICDAIRSVEGNLRPRGDGSVPTAAEIQRNLARRGSALACAVALQPSSQQDQSAEAAEQPQTVVPAGYAVLSDGKLLGFLSREQAVGADLLIGESGVCEIVVNDQAGLPVTLTLTGGSAALRPDWSKEGQLVGLEVQVEAEALLAESAANGTANYYLQQRLERELSERIRQVLQLSKTWRADYLGLQEKLELRQPGRIRALEPDFAALWPTLPVTVSVSARLTGRGDAEGAP